MEHELETISSSLPSSFQFVKFGFFLSFSIFPKLEEQKTRHLAVARAKPIILHYLSLVIFSLLKYSAVEEIMITYRF